LEGDVKITLILLLYLVVLQSFRIIQVLEQNLIRINESNLSVLLQREQFEN